jgi:hypothetical protein
MGLTKMQRKARRNRDDLLLGLWDIDYCGILDVDEEDLLPPVRVSAPRKPRSLSLITHKRLKCSTRYDDVGIQMYSVLPEMVNPEMLYPIVGFGRTYMINQRKEGRKINPWIVFYGGSMSGIPRRDVGSLRYICGDARFVMLRLREMEFRTWMDYRLYTMSMDKEWNYGKVLRRIDLSIDALTQMALLVPKRKKLAMLKKGRLEATKFNDTEAANREMLKTYMDNKVAGVVGNL